MGEERQYRVVQWATGNIGARALRALIDNPHMRLSGVYVTSSAKAGKDAGELCGMDTKIGVTATDNIADILSLDADCVLYMPAATNLDEVCAILASGKNLITPRGEFLHLRSLPREDLARIEKACAEGAVSVHSTGGSPGFVSEVLPLALLGQQQRVGCLTINEYADVSSRNSRELLFERMGFGKPSHEFSQEGLNHTKNDFAGSFHLLADAMNMPLDRVAIEGDTAVASKDVEISVGTVRAGTIAAMRITVTGFYKGKPLLRFRAHWYCSADIDQDWGKLTHAGWLIQMEGDCPMNVRIDFPVSMEDYAAFTPGVTAHRIINAIPAVCAAAPGLRTTLDLLHILPRA